jgi:predicted DNA-binding protein
VASLSEVVTIRVPRELKERMKRFENRWSEEIRVFIEERVRQLELKELVEEIVADPKRPEVEGDSTSLIREDRER